MRDMLFSIPLLVNGLLPTDSYSDGGAQRHADIVPQQAWFLFTIYFKHYQITSLKKKISEMIHFKSGEQFIELIDLLFTIINFSHLMACFWILLARYEMYKLLQIIGFLQINIKFISVFFLFLQESGSKYLDF